MSRLSLLIRGYYSTTLLFLSMNLRFVSTNSHKFNEAQFLVRGTALHLVQAKIKIDELQTKDENKLLREKALKAFQSIGKPLLVEHTGLYLEALNGLPGGLTQTFWDTLGADKLAKLFGGTRLTARTVICMCDGMDFHYFCGEIDGHVARAPRGKRDFQWDCVFIPVGNKETFAQMGARKNKISMRKKAFDSLMKHLKL